ncbi:hypothetical protein [Bradyrhizobium sp. BRP56]|uniref:hypothetical protein n=1 Tax=Bradyrhizobium sp. BRP56 TaxID=2793819 RepID=UPI001CD73640|nr:hypothetical protein [Bradyrhizobium sp. BRP56]MCA1397229.1 hypothetical protein [Bradyrhizobium sp. BRP56]
MKSAIHDQAAELILDAIYRQPGDYLLKASFFFGMRPGAPPFERRMGIEIYIDPVKLVRAALYVRKNGPPYLKYLPISAISGMLRSFVIEHYGLLADETFLQRFAGSYSAAISGSTKSAFADALAESSVFQPRNEVTLFPIIPVVAKTEFSSEPFFLVAASTPSLQPLLPGVSNLVGDAFPPFSDLPGVRDTPSVWLGVRSPDFLAANKIKAAILGALALTPVAYQRHLFSGRKMFGGRCTITDGGMVTFSRGDPHTPALASDIIIQDQDVQWLDMLASKLVSNAADVTRQIKALEYFYRAWPLDPAERFPILCMTLDAIFGEDGIATRSIIDGVRATLGSHVPEARLNLLMDLRNSVLHGGAPDVYDSRKYSKYYDRYGEDPINDMQLVVGRCLRSRVFNDVLKEHPDPNAEQIAQLQAAGRLPKNRVRPSLFDPQS